VQYVHARCQSIYREAIKQGLTDNWDKDFNPDFSLLTGKEERDLIKKICYLPDTAQICARSLTPHHMTTYLMECADLFHSFYEKCRVVNTEDEKLSLARLGLIKSIANTIRNGLSLLGVSAPERM
jgi:arginyl-tRNA synthetase